MFRREVGNGMEMMGVNECEREDGCTERYY